MQALKQHNIYIESTEQDALKTLKDNQYNFAGTLVEKGLNFKSVEDLKSVLGLGLLLGVQNPASKDNELINLIKGEWAFFNENLGVIKNFSYILSYRAITYILRVYNYPLIESPKENVVEKFTFSYTEEEALQIFVNNKEALVTSMNYKYEITDLIKPIALAKLLKLSMSTSAIANIYSLIKNNSKKLSLLGCSKGKVYNLTYRGALFLILQHRYPINLSLKKEKEVVEKPVIQESKVIPFPVKVESSIKENKSKRSRNNSPNMEVIKGYLDKKSKALKIKTDKHKHKAQISDFQLRVANEALFLIERASELLEEVGL